MMVFPTLLVAVMATVPQVVPPSSRGTDDAVLKALIDHGDASHAALDPLGALALFQRVLAEDSAHYGALWRASREAVNLGMLTGDPRERERWAEDAVAYARRARAGAPQGPEAAEWLSIALGRLALEQGVKTRARMAVEVRDVARVAIALDPRAAGAHHVLGEWHAEIRRLSGIERWAARKLLGAGELGEASWAQALEHLEKAAELAPGGLIHRLDLARAYLDRGRTEDARAQLQAVLDLPVIEPADPLHKREAERLLERLRAG